MIDKIARDFSLGEFESAYPYLSEDIKWHVVGESTTQGRERSYHGTLSTESGFFRFN